jgi:hypothetical protein
MRELDVQMTRSSCSRTLRFIEKASEIVQRLALMQDAKKTQHGKSVLYHIPALEVLQEFDHEAEKEEDEVATGGEAPNSEPPSPIMHEVQMASIPESETPGRRSKRRVETIDESSLERAERMEAARNLDFKGTISRYSLASALSSDGMA